MRHSRHQRAIVLGLALSLGALATFGAGPRPASEETGHTQGPACEELARILGGGTSTSGAVCKVTLPRSDLSVSLLGATLPAGMGLTSWAAFGPAGERGSIVMGDLALTSEELPEVMRGLREADIRVTAVHRHMLGESPEVSFMHYLGIGEAEVLARGLRDARERAPSAMGMRRVSRTGPQPAGEAGRVAGASCSEIARALGLDPAGADSAEGYCKLSAPRSDLHVSVDGIPVPASLGIGSWFAFRETTAGDAAVIAGDMALTQDQVNAAIGELTRFGIEVISLHNHMLFESPRVMFFHFQAKGQPLELARALGSALKAARTPDTTGRG